ncbi:unnamed protein product [Toxocara canis]|uniref:RNA-directed DNA polymerase, eukaryota, reverse transcriptase zinc-binding domain protein n=1 Tax=Toxocara canis TaxID=6265 RepID=A0A183UUI0_TOXCA|nr:unnamed protein product [Toxocara canis]
MMKSLGPNKQRPSLTKDDLRDRLSQIINATVVDDDGKWRARLLDDLLKVIIPEDSVAITEQKIEKPKFVIGVSDSVDDLALSIAEWNDPRTRLGMVSDDSLNDAQSQVDLANLGPLPHSSSEKPDNVALNSLIKKLKTTGIAKENFATLDDGYDIWSHILDSISCLVGSDVICHVYWTVL